MLCISLITAVRFGVFLHFHNERVSLLEYDVAERANIKLQAKKRREKQLQTKPRISHRANRAFVPTCKKKTCQLLFGSPLKFYFGQLIFYSLYLVIAVRTGTADIGFLLFHSRVSPASRKS